MWSQNRVGGRESSSLVSNLHFFLTSVCLPKREGGETRLDTEEGDRLHISAGMKNNKNRFLN